MPGRSPISGVSTGADTASPTKSDSAALIATPARRTADFAVLVVIGVSLSLATDRAGVWRQPRQKALEVKERAWQGRKSGHFAA